VQRVSPARLVCSRDVGSMQHLDLRGCRCIDDRFHYKLIVAADHTSKEYVRAIQRAMTVQ
jgi:hypothetical protein